VEAGLLLTLALTRLPVRREQQNFNAMSGDAILEDMIINETSGLMSFTQ
jgi:hypothetical protein